MDLPRTQRCKQKYQGEVDLDEFGKLVSQHPIIQLLEQIDDGAADHPCPYATKMGAPINFRIMGNQSDVQSNIHEEKQGGYIDFAENT